MSDHSTDNWSQVKADSIAVLPRVVVEHIERVEKLPHSDSHLISTLHKLQESMGFLGSAQLDAVAQLMQIPSAKVTGVASFYHYFRLKKTGRYVIRICMGTACYVKGANAIAKAFSSNLGIDAGETTPDGVFTIEMSRCLGVCSLAPVAMVNDEVHAHLKPDDIPGLLESYRQRIKEEHSRDK
ncbi:MAG: NADH-quinone oxidoreductase subunit NuoE [Fibrobacter sp.]|nr:NADH-quinone oxidoreductase subunit NuoE [Fibrobacter sp.]